MPVQFLLIIVYVTFISVYGTQKFALCPTYDNKVIGCSDCQFCPGGSVCAACYYPPNYPQPNLAVCPQYNSTIVGCQDCQSCPDGSLCPACLTVSITNYIIK